MVTKLFKKWGKDKKKNSNCDKTKNLKYDKTRKFQWWQNSKTQIVTKLKNSNCEKIQNLKLWHLLVKTTWHLTKQWHVLGAAFCNSRDVL